MKGECDQVSAIINQRLELLQVMHISSFKGDGGAEYYCLYFTEKLSKDRKNNS
jgi:hypothetical protein